MIGNDLFPPDRRAIRLGEGAVLLGGFASGDCDRLMHAIAEIAADAPFRHFRTRRGSMSVAMTNAGALGWVSDTRGYRYSATDPDSGQPWPPLPPIFSSLAAKAAAAAGMGDFLPDACLVNRYERGTRLALHQDREERDFVAPIVSVSLGAPAVFLWGGQERADPVRKLALVAGDVVVWGGESRFNFHGIAPLKDGPRYNITLRKAG